MSVVLKFPLERVSRNSVSSREVREPARILIFEGVQYSNSHQEKDASVIRAIADEPSLGKTRKR